MKMLRRASVAACGFALLLGVANTTSASAIVLPPLSETSNVIDLNDVKTNPGNYAFGPFRPGILKLFLSGDAASKHIAVLWYDPVGGVALHYHAESESVYVIDGTQTDAKGTYPSGYTYFNPPTSGHQVTNSTGFFLLAYAAPPDFANTHLIEEYTPVVVNTEDPNLANLPGWETKKPGVRVLKLPLDPGGAMNAKLFNVTHNSNHASFTGNYVLVLEGSCEINGQTFGEDTVVVAKEIAPVQYRIEKAAGASRCVTQAVGFTD